MKFFLDDLPILFPYEFVYPEQYEYMKDIKKALDAKVQCHRLILTIFSRAIAYLRCLQEQERQFVYCL